MTELYLRLGSNTCRFRHGICICAFTSDKLYLEVHPASGDVADQLQDNEVILPRYVQ